MESAASTSPTSTTCNDIEHYLPDVPTYPQETIIKAQETGSKSETTQTEETEFVSADSSTSPSATPKRKSESKDGGGRGGGGVSSSDGTGAPEAPPEFISSEDGGNRNEESSNSTGTEGGNANSGERGDEWIRHSFTHHLFTIDVDINPRPRRWFELGFEFGRKATFFSLIIIFCLKWIVDSGASLLPIFGLSFMFNMANGEVTHEVKKLSERNLLRLFVTLMNVAGSTVLFYYLFRELELYKALGFMSLPLEFPTVWSLLWVITVTDYIAKFLTVGLKICLVMLPGAVFPFHKRGKFFVFVEQSSQLYRSLLPIYPWIVYLSSPYETSTYGFGFFLAGIYLNFKIMYLVDPFKTWLKALKKLSGDQFYGSKPTQTELSAVNQNCPICFDHYINPVKLSCAHIFCQDCVAVWFDRDRTCPICRANVAEDPIYRNGYTESFNQIH